MTFTEIQTEILDRLSFTSATDTTRVGRAINRRYKEVTSTIGLVTSRRVAITQTATISSQEVTFTGVEKIITLRNEDGKVLSEITFEEMREVTAPASDNFRTYAIKLVGYNSVTILMDVIAQTEFTIHCDGHDNVDTLSGATPPAFPESFHDILVWGVLADEYRKLEKLNLAKDADLNFEKRLSELRFWVAKSAYLDTYQGKVLNQRSPIGGGSGGGAGAVLGLTSYTQTGLITFDRDPSAPFAVSAGSAVVTNLDADLLDGQHGSYYLTGANISGVALLAAVNAFTAFGNHTFSSSGSGIQAISVRNSAAGTANSAAIQVGNDISSQAGMLYVSSSTFTPSGEIIANATHLRAQTAGGLIIAANHASGLISFYAGGTTEAMRIHANRLLSIGAIVSGTNGIIGGTPSTPVRLLCVDGTSASPTTTSHYNTPVALFEKFDDSSPSGSTASIFAHVALVPTVVIEHENNGSGTACATGLAIKCLTSGHPSGIGAAAALIALVEANPGEAGTNRDCFCLNLVCGWHSGDSPGNLVGIEIDMINAVADAAAGRPGVSADNFTGVWCQAAGDNEANAAFFCSATGSAKWHYGIVLVSVDVGLYIESTGVASGYLIDARTGGSTDVSFRVTEVTTNPIYVRVNSTLKNVTEGAADSGGAGFKYLRVPN